MQQLLRLLTVSQAVGNLDMHGKNVSILHDRAGRTRMTPAYDVVPQTHFDTDSKMALAINGKYQHAAITLDDLVAEGESGQLRAPRTIITGALEAVRDFVGSEAPDPRSFPGLQGNISRFTANLLANRPTGMTG